MQKVNVNKNVGNSKFTLVTLVYTGYDNQILMWNIHKMYCFSSFLFAD